MGMKKVLIVGCFGFNSTTMARFTTEKPAVVRNDYNELTESKAKTIMPIANSLNHDFKVEIKETPRSKFIDKPRHNFRKR